MLVSAAAEDLCDSPDIDIAAAAGAQRIDGLAVLAQEPRRSKRCVSAQ